ncbi:MAG: hypothetical protein ABEJ28_03435, partial [Salinigranum sp.]
MSDVTGHGDGDQPGSEASDGVLGVDSSSWHVVALTPLYAITLATFVAGLAFAMSIRTVDLFTFIPAFLVMAALGLYFAVTFPRALYRDADAVATADVGWEPDAR